MVPCPPGRSCLPGQPAAARPEGRSEGGGAFLCPQPQEVEEKPSLHRPSRGPRAGPSGPHPSDTLSGVLCIPGCVLGSSCSHTQVSPSFRAPLRAMMVLEYSNTEGRPDSHYFHTKQAGGQHHLAPPPERGLGSPTFLTPPLPPFQMALQLQKTAQCPALTLLGKCAHSSPKQEVKGLPPGGKEEPPTDARALFGLPGSPSSKPASFSVFSRILDLSNRERPPGRAGRKAPASGAAPGQPGRTHHLLAGRPGL